PIARAGPESRAREGVLHLLGRVQLRTATGVFPRGFADGARDRIRPERRRRILAHLARAGGRGEKADGDREWSAQGDALLSRADTGRGTQVKRLPFNARGAFAPAAATRPLPAPRRARRPDGSSLQTLHTPRQPTPRTRCGSP